MKKLNSTMLVVVLGLAGIVVLLLCIFALPSLARETVQHSPEVAYLRYPVLLGMYATAIPYFYAIIETIRIIRIAEHKSLYSAEITQALSHIKYCALIILTLYVLGFSVLYYAHALPPIIALLGICIIVVTVLVANVATFIKNILQRQLALS